MKRLNNILMMGLALVVLTGAARTDPTKQVLLIGLNDVARHTEPDSTLGAYYIVSYSPPADLKSSELERALLDLYVDVTAKTRQGYVNEAPVLEVYALKEPFRDNFNPKTLDRDTRAAQPVAAGEGRRVVIDITRIVRSHLDGRLENHGLIIGSLTGMREGEFSLLSGKLQDGAVGRVRIYKRDVSDQVAR